MNKQKLAFSLIELSVAILIIGVLVSGVMVGISLIGKTKSAMNGYVTSNIPAEDRNPLFSSVALTPCTSTGATITKSNGKTIHTFTTSGTFTCPDDRNVKLLVVGGGGAGACFDGGFRGGGGGAGGLIYDTSYKVTSGNDYIVSVGGTSNVFTNGVNSSFGSGGSVVTALGGEAGIMMSNSTGGKGSGGGGTYMYGVLRPGGNGTAGQGNKGGSSYNGGKGSGSGGGGGACGAGGDSSVGTLAKGGDGCPIDIDDDGTPVYYAGGGAGTNELTPGINGIGVGGIGGGGGSNTTSGNGVANTGGGGSASCSKGGSGVVVVAY